MTISYRFVPTPVQLAIISEIGLFAKPEGVVLTLQYAPGNFIFGVSAFGVGAF